MLSNFFKTALRNILKHKAYALINLIGLTIGIGLCLLIITYVRSELSYDTHHVHVDRLHRMSYHVPNGLQLASTPPPIAPVLKDYFSEVEQVARVYQRNITISPSDSEGTESFEENDVMFVDSTFTEIFPLEVIHGRKQNLLTEPFTVVITEEMAQKYFGSQNPVGESLQFAGKHLFKVVAVVKNFPENTHIRFNMLVPYENMYHMETEAAAQVMRKNLEINFVISHSFTYVLLKEGATPDNINAHMGDFLAKYARPDLNIGQVFTLMPVKDIHLKSTLLQEPRPTNSMTTIYIFSAVGLLTLLIACINYINLSTAQSFSRVKEIGLRKILGSNKTQLIGQFLSESFLFTFVAFVLSFFVFQAALPLLNVLTDKHLVFTEVVDMPLIGISVGLLLLITLMAGSYPAYFVSQFESVHSIKNQNTATGRQGLRKALVVVQLGIASVLLCSALMIIKQLDFLAKQPLGFQREQVITIPLFSQNINGIFGSADQAFFNRLKGFRETVEAQAGVNATALSSASPGLGVIYRGVLPEGAITEDRQFIGSLSVDYDFVNTYGIELLAGRTFSKEFGTDQAEAFLINESTVKEFNWGSPAEAIGKTLNLEGKEGRVVGVVKDFALGSLTTAIPSLVMDINPSQYTLLSIRFDNADVPATLAKLEKEWRDIFPEKTFEYQFLDEQIDNQYASFQTFGTIIQGFTGIAMVISCLGVYGLVLFIVQRKVKEIGIRKVLGSSIWGILGLIYREFAWLILIGFVLAVPFSYWLINKWMQNFTSQIGFAPGPYVLGLLLVLLVVSATISFQALKASMANPVKSLKSE
ncbi:ABC transporter permease [Cytophagales bacterium LB-30]|uniref:ABC transporter permease n=1 Tax=Shiella aurantiaca TaxID=3058365 RepID=A0ABT8F3J6_9BACT|nr:ABC transporter permease [Shiella aurantiaca]MDN4164975.1 ABC transporter permease [Shiella aurantiaca]